MKEITNLALQLNAKISLNPEFLLKKSGRYFLLNQNLCTLLREDFYYAGTYLGKAKEGKFFPSYNLLTMLAKGKANKITVDEKTAWLFICGRDIFRKGITAIHGSRLKGAHTLVLNSHGECLGFGRITQNLDDSGKENKVAVKNISDVGDFLRREV
jgi:ribosome biogenesis protein Nip4